MEENNTPSSKSKLQLAAHKKRPSGETAQPDSPPQLAAGAPPSGNPAKPGPAADPGDPFAAIRKEKPVETGGLTIPTSRPEPEPELEPEAQQPESLPTETPSATSDSESAALPADAPEKELQAPGEPVPAPAPSAPAVESASSTEKAPGSGGLLASVFIVGALFLILGGAGAGIWLVLREPPQEEPVAEVATEATGEEPVAEAVTEPADEPGPVARAQQVVGALEANAEEANAIMAEPGKPGTAPEAAEEGEALVGSPADISTLFDPANDPSLESHREAITAYLAEIFVGAVGGVSSNPKAMIDGKNFSRGDVVNPELGLTFVDAKKGTLFFRDSYGITYAKRF